MVDRTAIILVSSGRHPVTGRVRAADCDARALRLALNLHCDGWTVVGLHAGREDDPALGEYFGMGLTDIVVLGPVNETDDAIPVLLDALRSRKPDLILCGQSAETGEGSGMLPHLLAANLGIPLVSNVCNLQPDPSGLKVIKAEPAGRRRQFSLAGRAVLAVGRLAPPPPAYAFGRMRRGVRAVEAAEADIDTERYGWPLVPARARPARIKATAIDNTAAKDALIGLSPDDAAAEILGFLKKINAVKGARSPNDNS